MLRVDLTSSSAQAEKYAQGLQQAHTWLQEASGKGNDFVGWVNLPRDYDKEEYGRIQAALAAGLPILHRAVSVKDQDIQLFPDFLRDRMDCIADVGASLRPWDLVSVGIRAGGSGLKWFLGFRRLASPRPSPKQEQTAPEGEAVEKAGGEAA